MGGGDVLDHGAEQGGGADLVGDLHAVADAERIDLELDDGAEGRGDLVVDGLADEQLVHGGVAGEEEGDADEIVDEFEGVGNFLVDAVVEPVGEDLQLAAEVEVDAVPVGQA